jgi:hypothetical protein
MKEHFAINLGSRYSAVRLLPTEVRNKGFALSPIVRGAFFATNALCRTANRDLRLTRDVSEFIPLTYGP